MASITIFCLLLTCLGYTKAATSPIVSTTSGELSFMSADGKDIVFQPGVGGTLMLNGVQIKSAADLKGAQGPVGPKGTIGDKGTKGDTGLKGAIGPIGPKGEKGQAGVDGTPGNQGQKGEQGLAGAKGDTGAAGNNGVKGETGAKGDTGAPGTSGQNGKNGVDGAKGETGAAGADGKNGADGKAGAAGAKGETGATGTAGKDGKDGATGPPGPPGPKGDSGSSAVCTGSVVPNCPFWLNINVTSLPVTGSPKLRFATSGFTELYHPDFEPSYTCHFDGVGNTVVSKYVAVTANTDPITKRIFYVVDCIAPNWTFSQANLISYTEKVNVSLWFQKKTKIPYAGKALGDQITFYAGWNRAQTEPSGSVTILGGGFNTSDYYACQFNSTTSLGVELHLNSTVSRPTSSGSFSCIPPHWNFTADSRIELNANVSVWRATATGVLLQKLPFFGVAKVEDQYKYYRCRDGVTNGVETDVDCGGLCPNLCPGGKKCVKDSDCATKVCSPTKTCGLPGQDKSSPVKNCKSLNWTSSAPAWLNWGSTIIQTYCNLDKTLDGGGWAMVWKHSYFQIDRTILSRMTTFSSYNQPCLSLGVGWCNVQNKQPSGATEQLQAAYHNGQLVYAYKARLNSALGKTVYGAYLSSAKSVVDKCTTGVGTKPSISTASYAIQGITFDKWSPDNYNSNCDTDSNRYGSDCRWENCNLPSSISSSRTHTQMTMVIYVR